MISANANQSIVGPATSITLLRRIQANDRDAWPTFVAIYHPLIFRWCRRKGLNFADADDVTQHVFQEVARDIAEFHRDKPSDTLRGWLRTITKHRLADYFRRLKHHHVGLGGSDFHRMVEEVEAPLMRDEEEEGEARQKQEDHFLLIRSAIEVALRSCSEQTREIFWRIVYHKEKSKDVAKQLGIGVHVVYLARLRAVKMVKERCVGLVDLDNVVGVDE